MSGKPKKNQGMRCTYLSIPVKYITCYKGPSINGKKDLCIVDFCGRNWALVGWVNCETSNVGRVRLCRMIHKDDRAYIRYRGDNILISDKCGWAY